MDYLLPTADVMPRVDYFITEDAPTPNNPFGAKGLGEVGLIAVGAAVAGAIDDALGGEFRVRRVPVHPQALFGMARDAVAGREQTAAQEGASSDTSALDIHLGESPTAGD